MKGWAIEINLRCAQVGIILIFEAKYEGVMHVIMLNEMVKSLNKLSKRIGDRYKIDHRPPTTSPCRDKNLLRLKAPRYTR